MLHIARDREAAQMPDRTLLDATAVRNMTALRDPAGALNLDCEHPNRRTGDVGAVA